MATNPTTVDGAKLQTELELAIVETGERMLRYFAYTHLPGNLQTASMPYAALAVALVRDIPSAVRAALDVGVRVFESR